MLLVDNSKLLCFLIVDKIHCIRVDVQMNQTLQFPWKLSVHYWLSASGIRGTAILNNPIGMLRYQNMGWRSPKTFLLINNNYIVINMVWLVIKVQSECFLVLLVCKRNHNAWAQGNSIETWAYKESVLGVWCWAKDLEQSHTGILPPWRLGNTPEKNTTFIRKPWQFWKGTSGFHIAWTSLGSLRSRTWKNCIM